MKRRYIYKLINKERQAQARYYNAEKTYSQKLCLMMEELGECAQALEQNSMYNLRDEMIQLVALGVRFLEEME